MTRLTAPEYEATVEKIARLNARAVKRGFTGRVTVTGTPVTETVTNAVGFEVTRTWIETTITGEPPSYGGWTFLAELDWASAEGLIVRAAPGAPPVDREGLRPYECDHCRTHRDRKVTYLVAKDGEQRQVGSTCIKDFLGWDKAPVFLADEDVRFDEGFGCGGAGGGGLGDPDVSPLTVLAAAWGVIQVTGYRKADSDNPTKYAVHTVLFPNPRSSRDREFAAKVRPYFEQSYEQAQIILDWLLSDAFAGDGDYVTNLKVAAKSETVGPRVFGLLVSAPVAWARAVDAELRRQAEADELVNEWFGTEKERLIVTARVKSIRELDGDFGVRTLYTLVTSDGHLVKYFSTRPVFGLTADDTWYTLKGTVKGHDEYRGAKETVLTRCVVLADSRTDTEPEPEPHELVPFAKWLSINYGWMTDADPDNPTEQQREGYDREAKWIAKQNRDQAKAWKARQAAFAEHIAPLYEGQAPRDTFAAGEHVLIAPSHKIPAGTEGTTTGPVTPAGYVEVKITAGQRHRIGKEYVFHERELTRA
jgi:hypothetical protein